MLTFSQQVTICVAVAAQSCMSPKVYGGLFGCLCDMCLPWGNVGLGTQGPNGRRVLEKPGLQIYSLPFSFRRH